MALIPMTETRLREAMRDPRYWQQGNPERVAYNAWVTEGWRALVQTPKDQASDGVVQVQTYERRGPDGNMVQVQAHQRGAPPARAWEAQPNPEWRAQIARAETNRDSGDFGYGMAGRPGSTALGRYQVNLATLVEAGWRRESDGSWTQRARNAGVTNNAAFLANPAAQEAAFNDVLRSYEDQLREKGILNRVGSLVRLVDGSTTTVTLSGLMAAAHREGADTVRRYFAHRDANSPRPAALPGRVRGDLSKFNQVEMRLSEFATIQYEPLRR